MSIISIQDSVAMGTLATTRVPAANSPPRQSPALTPSAKTNNELTQTDNQNRRGNSLSLEQAVDKLRTFVSPTDADISFAIDGASGVSVVKIVDRSTQDVIRQIPSEEAISLAMALDKLQGLFVREKA